MGIRPKSNATASARSGVKKRAAVIFHPDKTTRRKLTAAIEGAIMPLGWEPTLWLETTADEPGGEQALRAIAQGATHLLISGGDGTIREVVEALCLNNLGDKVTLGILPAGTGNVLARNLKIDISDLKTAVNRALHGNRHPIDLGLVRLIYEDGSRAERVFSVMAGMGLDAKIFEKTDAKLKKAIGWFAYIDGGIRSLPTLFERMDVSVDSRESRNLKVVSLIIGNVGWLPGKITLMPDASLDDGILDVAAVGPRRFWNWIDFWGRVTWVSNLRENRQLRHLIDQTADVKTLENLSGKKIRVTPENPVFIQLDGDPMGSILEAEFEVQPRAVTVRL
jgi:diacylglycerol kinase family enzyme